MSRGVVNARKVDVGVEIEELLDIDRQLDTLSKRRDEIAASLIDEIGVGNRVIHDGTRVGVTQNTIQDIDLETLQGISKHWYYFFTRRTLNKALLGLLVRQGRVPKKIAPYVTEKKSVAYLVIGEE